MITEITHADIEGLASRLDAADLDDHDREVLTGVFALAGVAAAAQSADVEGFAVDMFKPGTTRGVPIYMKPGELTDGSAPGTPSTGGLINGFSWGLKGGTSVGDPVGL